MKQAVRLLQLAALAAGASGTLQTECGASTGRERSRLSDLLGELPSSRYKTFCGPTPPALEMWRGREPCDEGLLFVTPGAVAEGSQPEAESEADIEGPAIFTTSGDLVWTQSGWGRTSDLKVQKAGDRSYITFWRDESSRQAGGGSYVVLSQSYEMVKELRPVGEISSKPVELKLTDNGTAILVMHNVTQASRPFGGVQDRWINEAIIQEVDMASNKLIHEWKASEHFDPAKSQLNSTWQGRSRDTAFDFFQATGLDLDHQGNYVISSRNMCNAAAVRRGGDGSVLWVLGGSLNSFGDGSPGQAATAMLSSHAVQWHGESTLLLLDSGRVHGQRAVSTTAAGVVR
ncbi:hypothetical protein NLG97_g1775 [Lecanicillium saksenae]|uniref:Uncharacterized protein n=1 Tax=Lecanicillium saksenae TaxID=468837 RepID=A0ACC1R630_9HYPO|nr:hypothetical protein NLG97_g1775 [Lecanicillium saksenae]